MNYIKFAGPLASGVLDPSAFPFPFFLLIFPFSLFPSSLFPYSLWLLRAKGRRPRDQDHRKMPHRRTFWHLLRPFGRFGSDFPVFCSPWRHVKISSFSDAAQNRPRRVSQWSLVAPVGHFPPFLIRRTPPGWRACSN